MVWVQNVFSWGGFHSVFLVALGAPKTPQGLRVMTMVVHFH